MSRAINRCYWPYMRRDISKLVQECDTCQKVKRGKRTFAGLVPIRTTRPGQIITSDIAGELPETKNGNKYALVVVNHFSK